MSNLNQQRSLDLLYPDFKDKVGAIFDGLMHWCDKHRPGCNPLITETYRSQARQDYLYSKGRDLPGSKVTNAKVSNHTSCLAADFALEKNDQILWNDEEFWQYFGHLCRAQGLTWGGNFRSIVDKPHVEWPVSDKKTYADAARWKKQKGLK